MFREFNVKFEDVEMLGGADNLLEGTEITKVIVRGDNNKMSSLDSMLKNCNELDTIDGELDLNGVGDIDNLLEGTELVKSINLKNINNENISANNSFPHVDRINIGGELYNKKAMQNVIASKDWTFDNINYSGAVGDNVVTKEVNVIDDNKVTIQNTLEQKARGIEIIGQTYENLVVGSGEATLLDELTLESVDGSTKEFNPHLEQPICVEVIEGETYQNLIDGKGEYKLTDTFSTTWTESSNSIENPPSMIEITEIFGNTVQDENDLNIIQSVGDLYVDESGEPILDEEGNEQYKLEIESNDNINILDYELGYDIGLYNNDGTFDTSQTRERTGKCYSQVKEGKRYAFYNNNGGAYGQWFKIYAFDENKRFIKILSNSYASSIFYYTIPKNQGIKYIKICITDVWDKPHIIEDGKEIKFYGSGKGLTNKTTILMPQPLRRVASVSDKLYWDNNKNKYIVEKNIDAIIPNINEYGDIIRDEFTNNERFTFNVPSSIKYSKAHTSTNDESLVVSNFIVCNYGDYDKVEYRNGICKASNQFKVFFEKGRFVTVEKFKTWFENSNTTFYYSNTSPQIIETKILEKPSLETYSPKTYISTNTEIQPSQMTITNKKAILSPMSLQANTDYTLQLDSIGKNDKLITVNLGGTETTIQPTNDTSKHHKVVVRTPATLTNETLELSGEGIIVNDVMLFEGGGNEIRQEVEYVEGIQNIGEDILNDIHGNIISWLDFNDLDNSINPTIWTDKTGKGNDFILEGFDFDGVTNGVVDGGLQVKKGAKIKANKTYNNIKSMLLCVNPRSGDVGQIDVFGTNPRSIRCCFREGDKFPYIAGVSGKNITSNRSINTTNMRYNLLDNEYNILYFELNDDISSVQNLIFGYDTNSNAQTTFKSMMLFDRKLNENEIKYMGNLCFDANSTYKIDILSTNSLTNISYEMIENAEPINYNEWTTFYFKIKTNATFTINKIMTNCRLLLANANEGDIGKTYINSKIFATNVNTGTWTSNGSDYICIAFHGNTISGGKGKEIILDTISKNPFSILSNDENIPKYPERYGSSQSILLPQPLNKIGEIKDKFYWDDDKEHYCIEQNIDENLEVLDAPNIIDLPHLNKKYSLDTYMPTTYLECANSPMQPSRLLLESDTIRYKPSALETDTDYTIQFECKEKSDKKVKLNLGGAEKEVDVEVGLNHVSITTPSEIDTSLYKDRLFLSGVGNKVADVIVNKGEMNQYPGYFNGVQSVGELQGDGTYKIDIKTNEGFRVSVQTNNPLTKEDKLYWNKSNKRYEIDRNGVIEVPVVEGDIIDLPRLYQRDDTNLIIESGNIKPAKTKIVYKDII